MAGLCVVSGSVYYVDSYSMQFSAVAQRYSLSVHMFEVKKKKIINAVTRTPPTHILRCLT